MFLKEGFFLKRIFYILLLLFTGILLIFLYFHNPSEEPFIVCTFNYFTGLKCPGCGSTRALYSLLHLDLLSAVRFNSFFVISLFLISYIGIKKLFDKNYKINKYSVYVYIFFLFVFTIFRNLV